MTRIELRASVGGWGIIATPVLAVEVDADDADGQLAAALRLWADEIESQSRFRRLIVAIEQDKDTSCR